MRESVKLQDEIGWNLTFCGLFDEVWGAHQEQFYASRSQRRVDETGLVWSTKVCSWMIQESRQVWLKRNEDVHKTSSENITKSEQETLEQIRHLYSLSDDVSHIDRAIFAEPLETLLQRPIDSLQQWLRNTTPVVNKCIRDFRAKLASGQRDIRQYLQRQQPIAPPGNKTQKSGSTLPE